MTNKRTSEITLPASEHLSALARISQQLRSSINLAEVLQTVFFEAMANTGSDGGHISLYRDSEGSFLRRHETGDVLPQHEATLLENEVMERQQSIVNNNLDARSAIRSVLITPILYEGVVAGLISLYSRYRNHFDNQTISFVNALANLATAAIVNAQYYQDTLERERFYGALGRVSLAISATVNLPSLLALVCRESLELFKVNGAYIWLVDENQLVGVAAEGHEQQRVLGQRIPLADQRVFTSAVARAGRGLLSNKFNRDKRYIQPFRWQTTIKAILGVPLRKDEDVIGVLELVDTTSENRFGLPDLEQATFFGSQATTAIHNAQLVTELRDLNEQLDSRVAERTKALGQEKERVQYLLRVTSELAASLDQDRVLIRALELVNEVVKATHGSILLVDSATGELIYPSAFETHKLPPIPRVDLGFRPEEGMAGWIIQNRSAVIIKDILEDDRWVPHPEPVELRSVLAVPLIAGDEVIGVLTLFHEQPDAFTDEQLSLVEAAATQVANAISNAQLYLLIRDQAERLGQMLREEHIESAKNQAILESIADGVIVADARGRVILANLSASQILEIPRKQLIGKAVTELLGLYAAAGDDWIPTVETWSRSISPEQSPQFLAKRLTFEEKIVSLRLSPVFASGQFFGTVSIFRDITQEVAVDRMKSEFVSTVSHELRTPMTSIKGYAELMLMGAAGDMSESQIQYLEVIRNNADRMSGLVNDLLDISRIESGRTTLEREPVDVNLIIQQVVEVHLRGLIKHENKPIAVITEAEPSLPMVIADRDRLTQILTNLVDNAFNYTSRNGNIWIRAYHEDDRVYICVTDTGIGISKEEQEKVFDRFFRSEREEVQMVPGTGLGLAIVRSLVEMHGGEIEVESEPGQGSTFTFYLPALQTAHQVPKKH